MFVQLTFEMSTVPGQQYSFSTHKKMFLWKCRNFWDRKCLDPNGTLTPQLSDSCQMFWPFRLSGQTFSISCFWTLAHKSMHQAEANEEPLRNSYPSAITCRPWATNPRDHHMHITVTWERPETNRNRNLHHWKQICCVKLKLNCYPWLGIFWICCLTLIHQSPTGRWLIVAGRLQCMCDFCLILIRFYVPW